MPPGSWQIAVLRCAAGTCGAFDQYTSKRQYVDLYKEPAPKAGRLLRRLIGAGGAPWAPTGLSLGRPSDGNIALLV